MFNKYTVPIVLSFSLLVLIFKPLDRTPLEETNYFKRTFKNFNKLKNDSIKMPIGDTIRVGWAKESLIPPHITSMAGYGARKGANYEGINDSIWVRAVVFDNGISRSVYVSMDLLIVPPNLDRDLLLEGTSLSDDDIYFTASHTHSSIGGYLEGLAGNIFGGKYDQRNLDFITNQTRKAILKASKDLSKAMLGYGSIFASDFITNRLVGDSIGTYDPYLRLIKIHKDNGENAAIFSYSAHATCFGHKQRKISGDYPGKVVSMLEDSQEIDFAVFGAGAVGSMSPRTLGKDGEKKLQEISYGLFERILPAFRSIGTKYEYKLNSNILILR